MFQYTIDRAARLTPWERVVVVAARHHQQDVWSQLDGRSPGMVLLQPKNVETAAGSFVALTFILARDPDATVIIYPSDHVVHPEERFLSAVVQAVEGSRRLAGRPVVLGAKPESWDLERGWIEPGRCLETTGEAGIRAVEGFVETPNEPAACRVNSAGGLWNTMVLAAGGKNLWELGWACFPAMMHRLDHLKDTIDTGEEVRALEAMYEWMPRHKAFSSQLLERSAERFAVMEMHGVVWSASDNPARTTHTLDGIGKQPLLAEGPPLPFLYQG
jgi:mannose-1-phosphate guanylyltransferase